MADDFGFFSSSEGAAAEEDPAAAFLAQQESEIAGIENDEGFGPADGESGTAPAGQAAPPEPGERRAAPGGRGRGPAGSAWLPRPVGTEGAATPVGVKEDLCPLLPRGQGGVPSGLHPPRRPVGLGIPVGCTASPVGDGVRGVPPVGRRRGSPVDQACIPARAIWGLCLVPKGLTLGFSLKPQDLR